MEPGEGKQVFNWSKAAMVAASMLLGGLLLCGLRRLAAPGGIDGLGEALQIVAAPGGVVLVILMPYVVVRSGGEWAEERQAQATLSAERAQLPSLSLLRASGSLSTPDELLLRPAPQKGDTDPQQLLRAVSTAATD